MLGCLRWQTVPIGWYVHDNTSNPWYTSSSQERTHTICKSTVLLSCCKCKPNISYCYTLKAFNWLTSWLLFWSSVSSEQTVVIFCICWQQISLQFAHLQLLSEVPDFPFPSLALSGSPYNDGQVILLVYVRHPEDRLPHQTCYTPITMCLWWARAYISRQHQQ